MGSVAKIPELAFLAFHNRSFMPFSAHHFCQETIFATEPLFPSFVELGVPVASGQESTVGIRSLRRYMLSIGTTGCFRSLETQREKDGSHTLYGWDSYLDNGSTRCFFILPFVSCHLLSI
jgi:hypothetical protein